MVEESEKKRVDSIIESRYREEGIAEEQLQRARARLMLQRRKRIAHENAEAQWRSDDSRALRTVERKREESERQYITGLRLQAHEFRLQKRAREIEQRRRKAVANEKKREARLRAMRARKMEEQAAKRTDDGVLARAREGAIRRALVRNARREAELERANAAKREQRELERRLKEEEAELQKLEDEHARFEQRAGRVEERFLEAAAISAARSKHTHRISPAAMLSETVKEMARYHGDCDEMGSRRGVGQRRKVLAAARSAKVADKVKGDGSEVDDGGGSVDISANSASHLAICISPVRVVTGEQGHLRTPSEESTAIAAAVPLPPGP